MTRLLAAAVAAAAVALAVSPGSVVAEEAEEAQRRPRRIQLSVSASGIAVWAIIMPAVVPSLGANVSVEVHEHLSVRGGLDTLTGVDVGASVYTHRGRMSPYATARLLPLFEAGRLGAGVDLGKGATALTLEGGALLHVGDDSGVSGAPYLTVGVGVRL